MKYKSILKHFKIPEWSEYYFEYEKLKSKISKMNHLNVKITEEKEDFVINTWDKPNNNIPPENRSDPVIATKSISKVCSERIPKNEFICEFNEQIEKVEIFFIRTIHDLESDLENVKNSINNLNFDNSSENNTYSISFKIIKVHTSNQNDLIIHTLHIIYRMVCWLRNFCIVNSIASHKIIEKYKRDHKIYDRSTKLGFDLSIFDVNNSKKFDEIISKEEELKNEVIKIYAKQYTDENIRKAKLKLDSSLKERKRGSLKIIIVQLVIFSIFLCLYFLLTYIPTFPSNSGQNKTEEVDKLNIFFPAFSFCYMLIALFYGLVLVLIVFRKYKINYVYLFEFNNKFRLNTIDILNNIFWLSVITTSCLISYRIGLTFYESEIKSHFYIFSIPPLFLFFIYLLFPFKVFIPHIRYGIIVETLRNCFPFGKKGVKFKDFIYGDILTSLVKPFANLTLAFCLISCMECRDSDSRSTCNRFIYYSLAAQVIPFLCRLFQCLNRLYYTKAFWPHLANAFKYAFASAFYAISFFTNKKIIEHKNSYIGIGIVTFLYLLFWDFVVDWGLLRFKTRHFLLRDKISYPQWWYYVAMLNDTVLRLLWIISIYDITYEKETLFFITSILEVFRRVVWVIFRVENEHNSNLELYRSYLVIPELSPDHM